MARARLNGNHLYITKYTNDDLNPLLNRITADFKGNGYLIIDKLNLIIAGSKEGYYIENNDSTVLSITSRCFGAVDSKYVKQVLEFAIDIGYYDKKQFLDNGIITSRELQLMHFQASENREEVYILSEYSLLKKEDIKALKLEKNRLKIEKIAKKDAENVKKDAKTGISSVRNDQSSIRNDQSSERNDQSSRSYLHKEYNIKEKEIKRKKESVSDCDNNSDSDCEDKELLGKSVKHDLLKSLVFYNLVPTDPLTLKLIDAKLFELNKELSTREVINVSQNVLNTFANRKKEGTLGEIYDYVKYIEAAIREAIYLRQNRPKFLAEMENKNLKQLEEALIKDSSSIEQEQKEELEKLKAKRKNKKSQADV